MYVTWLNSVPHFLGDCEHLLRFLWVFSVLGAKMSKKSVSTLYGGGDRSLLMHYPNSIEKSLMLPWVFLPLRGKMVPNPETHIRLYYNCCFHYYFAPKLQDYVATQWGLTKLNNKLFFKDFLSTSFMCVILHLQQHKMLSQNSQLLEIELACGTIYSVLANRHAA